jgi:tetratricopeptide (TPR) repeat protein
LKKRNSIDKMTDNNKQVEKDPEVAIESAIGRSEAWLQRNAKVLLTVLAAAVVVVGGYFAYQYLYKGPRQQKATEAMFRAEEAFASDDYTLALNGDGNALGFLQIIDQYGGTAAANLACHYVGQCYLQTGDFANAITYFDRYKRVEKSIPALLVNALNAGLTGDAWVESGDLQKGAAQYEKAVKESDNALTAPYYSRKAGDTYMQLGDNAKALEMYNNIKVHYPASAEAREVDKAIARVEQKL